MAGEVLDEVPRDFTGLRDWQAGDRFEHIDWPQSSLTNFSPFVVREFEQPSSATVVAIADPVQSARDWFEAIPTCMQRVANYHELLANPAVEVVYVAVPHVLHEEVYGEVLASG